MTKVQEAPAFVPPWGNSAVEGQNQQAALPSIPSLQNPFDLTDQSVAAGAPEVVSMGIGHGTVTLEPSDVPPPSQEEMNQPPPDQQVFNDDAFRQMMAGEGLGRRKDVVIPDAALSKNPFKPAPKSVAPKAVAAVHLGQIPRPEGTPMWADFARFIMKHGDVIIAAKYPHPYGECVDTMWRGVPVTHDDQVTEVRHVTAGWIDWSIAKDDE